MSRLCAALAGLAMLAGCVAAPPPPSPMSVGPDPLAVQQAIGMAAEQVRRCYRPPRVSYGARYVTTVLRVRYALDGTLIGLPEVKTQTGVMPETRADAARMAEAAGIAVLRCSPLRLPPELYQRGWDEFELTFTRRAVA